MSERTNEPDEAKIEEVRQRQASPEGDPVGTPEEVIEKQGGGDAAPEGDRGEDA